MKIESLKIGNIVLVHNEIHEIQGIISSRKNNSNDELSQPCVYTSYQQSYVCINDIKPIILKVEHLDKFGFEYQSNVRVGSCSFLKENVTITDHYQSGKFGNFYFEHSLNDYCLQLYYVHQLQNLYYELTSGCELVFQND